MANFHLEDLVLLCSFKNNHWCKTRQVNDNELFIGAVNTGDINLNVRQIPGTIKMEHKDVRWCFSRLIGDAVGCRMQLEMKVGELALTS